MNHSLYVFEGVDGSGKTSLAKNFASEIHAQYYKGLPATLKPFKNFVDKRLSARFRYWFYLLGNRMSYKELEKLLRVTDVVVDQYVYCTVAFHTVSMDRELKKPSPKIIPQKVIYLTASWNEIDKRLNERGGRKRLEELSYLQAVDTVYRELFKGLSTVIYFNTEGRNVEENTAILKKDIGL